MATSVSYLQEYRECRSHDSYNEIFQATINRWSSEINLSSVKSCLTIGPGEGVREVPFIKGCAANTNRLIAFEPDHESAESLRTRLAEDLPGVDSQVFETKIENWKGMVDQVDLVVMMLVLTFICPNERKELYKKLHNQWLAPGGRVVVVSSSRTKCPGNVSELSARLGAPVLAWEAIEAEFFEAGFIKQYADETQCVRHFSSIEDDQFFWHFIQYFAEKPAAPDHVRSILEELFPEGKADEFFTLGVFQKT